MEVGWEAANTKRLLASGDTSVEDTFLSAKPVGERWNTFHHGWQDLVLQSISSNPGNDCLRIYWLSTQFKKAHSPMHCQTRSTPWCTRSCDLCSLARSSWSQQVHCSFPGQAPPSLHPSPSVPHPCPCLFKPQPGKHGHPPGSASPPCFFWLQSW